MAKAFKKVNDLPAPPKFPTPSQILEDLKAADIEDPVFFESSDSINIKAEESFQAAKEFMMTTTKLRDFESLLSKQKSQLQDNYEELRVMSENIRKQATEALSNVY